MIASGAVLFFTPLDCKHSYTLTKYRITFLSGTHNLDGFSFYLNSNAKENQNVVFSQICPHICMF